MNGLGISELIVIGILLLIAVGPERLPHATRTIGRLYGRVRRASEDLRRALVLEADRLDEEERLKGLRKRRQQAEEERRAAEAEGSRAQPQGPAAAAEEAPAAPGAPVIPPGFTPAEWDELPLHVRELIARRGAERVPEA